MCGDRVSMAQTLPLYAHALSRVGYALATASGPIKGEYSCVCYLTNYIYTIYITDYIIITSYILLWILLNKIYIIYAVIYNLLYISSAVNSGDESTCRLYLSFKKFNENSFHSLGPICFGRVERITVKKLHMGLHSR